MIDKNIRQLIRERAKYLCEYCHSPEEASAALFEQALASLFLYYGLFPFLLSQCFWRFSSPLMNYSGRVKYDLTLFISLCIKIRERYSYDL